MTLPINNYHNIRKHVRMDGSGATEIKRCWQQFKMGTDHCGSFKAHTQPTIRLIKGYLNEACSLCWSRSSPIVRALGVKKIDHGNWLVRSQYCSETAIMKVWKKPISSERSLILPKETYFFQKKPISSERNTSSKKAYFFRKKPISFKRPISSKRNPLLPKETNFSEKHIFRKKPISSERNTFIPKETYLFRMKHISSERNIFPPDVLPEEIDLLEDVLHELYCGDNEPVLYNLYKK